MKTAKFIALLLAILTLTAAFTGCGGSETGQVTMKEPTSYSEGLNFTQLKIGGYSVGLGDCEDTDVVIPAEHEGKPVKMIMSSAFRDCETLTSVWIPDGVLGIEPHAFDSCINLTDITLPDSLTHIGRNAFSHCESLQSIVIPDDVGLLEDCAFSDCKNLTSVTLPIGVGFGDNVFDDCDSLESINFKGTTADWEKIVETTMGGLHLGSGKFNVVCTDGTVTQS